MSISPPPSKLPPISGPETGAAAAGNRLPPHDPAVPAAPPATTADTPPGPLALESRQRRPRWLSSTSGNTASTEKRKASPTEEAPRPRPFQTGNELARWTPAGLQQHAREQQTLAIVLDVAQNEFGRDWNSFNGWQQSALLNAASRVPPGGNVEAAVRNAILRIQTRQHMAALAAPRQDQTLVIDHAMFTPHSIAGTCRYSGYTVNGPHYAEDGSPRYYLEAQFRWACSQHAVNAMAGGPLLSITDLARCEAERTGQPAMQERIAAEMLDSGVRIETIRQALLNKGIATHCFEPVMLNDEHNNPVLDPEQVEFIDTLPTDRLLLQCDSHDNAISSHFVAFRRLNDRLNDQWVLLDSQLDAPQVGVSPSAYLTRQGAINFTAVWPQQRLTAAGASALAVDARQGLADRQVADAELAGRLGITVAELPSVIPEWKDNVLRVWQARSDMTAASRVAPLVPLQISSKDGQIAELGGDEGRQLYGDLLQYQYRWHRELAGHASAQAKKPVPAVQSGLPARTPGQSSGATNFQQSSVPCIYDGKKSVDHWAHCKTNFQPLLDACITGGHIFTGPALLRHLHTLCNTEDAKRRGTPVRYSGNLVFEFTVTPFPGMAPIRLWRGLDEKQLPILWPAPAAGDESAHRKSLASILVGLTLVRPTHFDKIDLDRSYDGDTAARQWKACGKEFSPLLAAHSKQMGLNAAGAVLLQRLQELCIPEDDQDRGLEVKGADQLAFEFSVVPFEGMQPERVWRGLGADNIPYFRLAPAINDAAAHQTKLDAILGDLRKSILCGPAQPAATFDRDIAQAYSWPYHAPHLQHLLNDCIAATGRDIESVELLMSLEALCTDELKAGRGIEVADSDGTVREYMVTPFTGMRAVQIWCGRDRSGWPTFRIAPAEGDPERKRLLRTMLNDMMKMAVRRPQLPAVNAYSYRIAVRQWASRTQKAKFRPLHERCVRALGSPLGGYQLMLDLEKLCQAELLSLGGKAVRTTGNRVYEFSVTPYPGMNPEQVWRGLDSDGIPHFRLPPEATDAVKRRKVLASLLHALR